MIISLIGPFEPMPAPKSVMQRDPELNPPKRTRAGGPFLLFRLAPHGVYRAPFLADRPVSFYLAFSPVPNSAEALSGGLFSVTLSVAQPFQVEHPRSSRGMLPFGVRTFLDSAKK